MTSIRTLLPLLAVLALTGCATGGNHVTDSKSGWINMKSRLGDPQLYYCMANEKEGSATPVCVRPETR